MSICQFCGWEIAKPEWYIKVTKPEWYCKYTDGYVCNNCLMDGALERERGAK